MIPAQPKFNFETYPANIYLLKVIKKKTLEKGMSTPFSGAFDLLIY